MVYDSRTVFHYNFNENVREKSRTDVDHYDFDNQKGKTYSFDLKSLLFFKWVPVYRLCTVSTLYLERTRVMAYNGRRRDTLRTREGDEVGGNGEGNNSKSRLERKIRFYFYFGYLLLQEYGRVPSDGLVGRTWTRNMCNGREDHDTHLRGPRILIEEVICDPDKGRDDQGHW